jgi:YVTN family beta-propeller protein
MIADPWIGTQLAEYRIESLIGRGGMSVVYLAEDVRLKRRVALKLLSPELAQSENFRERFVRESELAASLDHPNIIPIFEAGEVEGSLYIAMRYVEGTDLGALIHEQGHLTADRTLSLLSQAASALDAAHARGLIHRDVKPGNMLITSGPGAGRQEHLYLSDFGVTKRSTSDSGLTGTGQFVGTLDYAAPEQFEGARLDSRTDVYSLGCVLYGCLTGEIPFRRDNQAALVYAHLMAEPPKITEAKPEFPEAVDEVVAKALAKKPENRYPTAGELIGAARQALAPKAVIAPPTAPPSPLARKRPLLIGAGVAVLAIMVLLGALLLRGGDAGPATPSVSPTARGLADSDRLIRISQATSQSGVGHSADIEVGTDPWAVAIGEGSVWVANQGDGTVSRMDPVANQAEAVIEVGPRPVAIAFGEGSVWVVNRLGHSVSRIDPARNEATATIDLETSELPSSIAVAEGAVWIGIDAAGDNAVPEVHRIDPSSNRVAATIRTPQLGPIWIVVAAGEAGVWGADSSGHLYRIDPQTNELEEVADVGAPAAAITLDGGSLWIATLRGEVLRVDPQSAEIQARMPGSGVVNCTGQCATMIPSVLTAMTSGQGLVWVADKSNGAISRIVEASNSTLQPIRITGTPTGVAVGYGSVWVTVDASG